MAITSANDAVNLALDLLGEAPVTDYTTDTDLASQAALRHYANARDTTLREGTWAFATRIAVLVASADDADDDWSYKYDLPAGCLKPISIFNSDRTAEDLEFTTRYTTTDAKEVLVTDTESASLVFIYQETDVTKWDANFIEAFSYRLAANLAMPVTQNVGLKVSLEQLYDRSLMKARQIDASKARQDVMQIAHQDFITARA